MSDDVLGDIIEVEREISGQISSEKKKAGEWLEKVRAEAAEKVLAAENDLKASFDREAGLAKREAEEKAGLIIHEAAVRAGYLHDLNDETLKRVVIKHLRRILPGERHDRPDVKN